MKGGGGGRPHPLTPHRTPLSTDIKTDVKQEIKKQEKNFSQKPLLKIKIQYKAGLYFPFNLDWHSIQFDPLSVTKDIC